MVYSACSISGRHIILVARVFVSLLLVKCQNVGAAIHIGGGNIEMSDGGGFLWQAVDSARKADVSTVQS